MSFFLRSRTASFATRACLSRPKWKEATHSFFAMPLNAKNMKRTSTIARRSFSNSQQGETDECPLPFTKLPYSGTEVRLGELALEDEEFLRDLRRSIEYWKGHDVISSWVHVPASRASVIEALTADEVRGADESSDTESNHGFAFELHHVNATDQTIILKKWLRKGSEDKIPPFATHQVGCAGFVLNDKNELLVIQEWRGPPSNRTRSGQWKLPGGLLDAGETFEEAACREVEEETGVKCQFESLLTFWHRHGLTFGKSDLYFVCMLRPTSEIINIDPVEVSAAKWMSIEEFVQTQDHPLILHVLKSIFQIDEYLHKEDKSQRLVPHIEMMEGAVQWPDRQPFPTYTGRQR